MKKVIRNIKYFIPLLFKINPMIIIVMVLKAILSAIINMLYVVIPALIIKELTTSKDINILILYTLILAITTGVIRIIISFFNSVTSLYTRKANYIVEEMINNKVMEVDYFNLEDPVFLDYLDRTKKGMGQYTDGVYTIVYSLGYVLSSIFSISGCVGIVLLSKEYIVMFVSLIGIIINIFIYYKIQNNQQIYRNKEQRPYRRAWYYTRSIASFRTQKELRMYNGEEIIDSYGNETINEIDDCLKDFNKKDLRFAFLDLLNMYVVLRFLTIFFLAYSAYKSGNIIDISAFSMLFAAIITLDQQSAKITYDAQTYFKACTYQDDFISLMKMESVFKNGVKKISTIESIEFKNVYFKYPRTEKYILEDVSFKITNKEKFSLVGLNGSGKTTIIKLLCRFYEIDEGSILVNGENINSFDYDSYMKLLGIVFQDFKVISFSIKSNIANLDDNQEKLYDCLKRSQVYDKVQSLPNKENTYINKWFDKSGVEFSGGEMQKFALARALYKECDFVVLDEPTSALDPVSEAEIYYHFKEVVGHKLTLFISHRLSSCIFSDKILVLDGAKIVETGTHKELMKKEDGLYKKMFDAQSEYYK